ncbi:MAG: NAD(P)-dependent oxidoreductase [Actinomycetota bacterium]|jgi:2-hydroxy-3-oxopropionate reductase|nr:NAD(P)-dependent oxidoreductase [Actinomycetota bacterium]
MTTSTEKTRLGFIGLGAMGLPMVQNLLRAGHQVTVMSRSPAPVEKAVRAGALQANDPRSVADRSDLVITMLPTSADVLAVFEGPAGVLAGAHAGLVFIDMSSVAPGTARRVAELGRARGIRCLDAPVSGGVKGACEGTLAIMVGGEDAVVDEVMPILATLGRKVVHVGPAGAGQVAKIANQMIVAGSIAVVAEALTVAREANVQPSRVIEALEGGFADSAILRHHGRRMVADEFDRGFRLSLQLKDLDLAMDLAREEALNLSVTSCVRDLVARAVVAGFGEADHAALIRVVARDAASLRQIGPRTVEDDA